MEATIRALDGLLGTVRLRVNVPASVTVDGLAAGSAPGDVRIPGGVHTLEVQAEGYVTEEREVRIAARQVLTLEFELVPLNTYEGINAVPFGVTAGVAGATLVAGVVVGSVGLAEKRRLDADGYPNTRSDLERSTTFARSADVLYGTVVR
ncbi:MAG: PEGA domain-containing protein [Sandaracinaceae bacterium]|nr:PEGA domain-containing protein [Sandaracinaceae bacterium]